ncbi:hypothetical protein [Polyangium sorediatum]|uniref:Integral membrane protein n=1 Tax=Polyangium sorediatum TaxID=889274 RepID=A0ABT6NJ99_9BACT|nr:hypothetical protein [Polyangium sorediatum]MDI1428384.1 hypothetical protein [Polyangium sorediatum]
METTMMDAASYLIPVYAAYAVTSVGLTVGLARTLFRSGAVFLTDVFKDNPGMAEAVNRLLVVGFYLLNFGYACLIMKAERATDIISAVEILAAKLGLLLLSLGVIHFGNVYLFHRMRRRAQMAVLPPPVVPQLKMMRAGAE